MAAMSKHNAACCGCGWTGRMEYAMEHISSCVKYAERWQADPDDECLDPGDEWERRQWEQDDGEAEAAQAEPEAAEPVSKAPARRAEAILDAKVVVLDMRGEAQRESDEIRTGFDVYRRIGAFIRKERYRDIGYDSALAWWEGEHIFDYSQIAEADRKDLVLALTGAGLSVRATGAMLAISPAQVQRDKTGKSSSKATTREGRRSVSSKSVTSGNDETSGREGRRLPKVSPHTRETAGQAPNGAETPGTVAVAEDPFAFLADEDVSAGSTPNGSSSAEDHECVCPVCGHGHRTKGAK